MLIRLRDEQGTLPGLRRGDVVGKIELNASVDFETFCALIYARAVEVAADEPPPAPPPKPTKPDKKARGDE